MRLSKQRKIPLLKYEAEVCDRINLAKMTVDCRCRNSLWQRRVRLLVGSAG